MNFVDTWHVHEFAKIMSPDTVDMNSAAPFTVPMSLPGDVT